MPTCLGTLVTQAFAHIDTLTPGFPDSRISQATPLTSKTFSFPCIRLQLRLCEPYYGGPSTPYTRNKWQRYFTSNYLHFCMDSVSIPLGQTLGRKLIPRLFQKQRATGIRLHLQTLSFSMSSMSTPTVCATPTGNMHIPKKTTRTPNSFPPIVIFHEFDVNSGLEQNGDL